MGKAKLFYYKINDAHPNLLLELAITVSCIKNLAIVKLRIHT